MAEVIIELDLKRRSGVLAGAVAALRNLSLDFKSQQLTDHEGQPRLILTTEGEVADLAEVEAAYEQARGVSGLADVLVDGRSLVHLPPEPEPEPEFEPEQEPEPEPEPELELEPASLREPEPIPEPDESMEPVSEAPTAPAPALEATESEAIRPEELFDVEAFVQQSMSEGKPAAERKRETSSSESLSGLKPSMVRRRRRRR